MAASSVPFYVLLPFWSVSDKNKEPATKEEQVLYSNIKFSKWHTEPTCEMCRDFPGNPHRLRDVQRF